MWKCSSCHSTDVEALDWVDLNSGEVQDDGLGEFYCRSCESQVDVYYEENNSSNDSGATPLLGDGGD